MSRRCLTAVVAALGVWLSACGGGERAETPPPADTLESSSSSGPSSVSSTSEATTTIAMSSYSEQPTGWVDEEGWTYRFDPSWSGLKLRFSKSTETSPPGKAKFVIEGFAPASFPGRLVANTAGRNPPSKVVKGRAFYPIVKSDQFFLSESSLDDGTGGTQNGLRCQVSSYLSSGKEYLGKSGLASFAGLLCGTFESTPSGGNALQRFPVAGTGFTGDNNEGAVDALLAAVSSDDPVYVLEFGSGSCLALYFPDGRRSLTSGNSSCKLS